MSERDHEINHLIDLCQDWAFSPVLDDEPGMQKVLMSCRHAMVDQLAEITRLRAENTRLREALEEIHASYIPSQPMTEPCDEITWAQMWVGHLRHVAGAALKEPTP